MSDDEADEDLLELLRKSLGIGGAADEPPRIRVLEDAQFVYDNATDVAIDMQGTKAAAKLISDLMHSKAYSTKDWHSCELHPTARNPATVHFIFTMDLLNFSFWSDADDSSEAFSVAYNGKKWTGYWSLVASLHRALDEQIPITTPSFWVDEELCNDDLLSHVFRSSTDEQMPMLPERMQALREAGQILQERFDGSFLNILEDAGGSAAAVVNTLTRNFPCFDDSHRFEDQRIRFDKRAQILIADLWACFDGEDYGHFSDIDQISMFADYRLPQILHSMGCIFYSPPLHTHIRTRRLIESGHSWEIQLRGCSIWCVELIRREITRQHPETHINAILIDFFLYDTIKQMEREGEDVIPHHRTRSIWY